MEMFAVIVSSGWSVADAKKYLQRYAIDRRANIKSWITKDLGSGYTWVEGRT